MVAHVHQFMCLKDNYGALIYDPETRHAASIDAPDAEPVLKALDEAGWELTDILVTHHHADHTQGLAGLKKAFPKARVVGPVRERDKIPALEQTVGEDDFVMVGALKARVIETPGHTSGHVTYHFEAEELLFAGDTLFALGCGRPIEEPPRILYHSLMRLARLPGCVQVYCGHEYTQANARFALSVDAENDLLVTRAKEVEALRAKNAFTLPTTIALERATNPFLRAEEDELKAAIGLPDADAVDVFAALRERKNRS